MRQQLLLLFTLLSFSLISQELSTYPGIPTATFNRVDVSGDYVIALGSCDYVWYSKNGGVDWETEYMGWLSLTGLRILPNDPTRALIVVDRNLVLFDMDEGIIETYDNTDFDLRDIKSIEILGDDIYVCNYTGLYKSPTSNIDWQQVWEAAADGSNNPNIMTATDDFVYITTWAGQLIKLDRSDHSVVKTVIFDNNLSEISMGTNTHGVAVISGVSKPVRTIDGWDTFYELEEFSFGRNVHAAGENKIFLVLGGTFEISTNGGESVEVKIIDDIQINSIRDGFSKANEIYVYGAGTTFAKTEDNGDTWIVPNQMIRSDLKVIAINKSGVGYACGQGGYMVKTIDHGNTWEPYEHTIDVEYEFSSIVVLNNGNVILTDGSKIYIMRDGVVIDEKDDLVQRLYKDSNDAFLLSQSNIGNSQYQINRSEDGGMTWSKVLDLPRFSSEINVGDDGYIYILPSYETYFFKSMDKGITWDSIDINTGGESLNVIDGTWYLRGSNKLFRSIDEGQTWAESHTGYLITIPQKGADGFLYVTTGANNQTKLHMSMDEGLNWEIVWEFCAPPNQFILNHEGKFVITHGRGHINLFPRPIMSGIDETTEFIVTNQFYPNPVGSGEILYFGTKFKEASIFDMNARELQTYDQPSDNIRLPHLAEGTYLIRYEIASQIINKLIVVL